MCVCVCPKMNDFVRKEKKSNAKTKISKPKKNFSHSAALFCFSKSGQKRFHLWRQKKENLSNALRVLESNTEPPEIAKQRISSECVSSVRSRGEHAFCIVEFYRVLVTLP